MTDLKTTQEISRTPDGTEYVRLATVGANWKATLSSIFTALTSLTVGTTPILSGTSKHVVYDSSGIFQEAANFTIESGNPNVIVGNAYQYDGVNILYTVGTNFFDGGAGNFTLTGTGNMGTGSGALVALTTGPSNCAIGTNAGNALTVGSSNLLVGTNAGASMTGNSGSVCIGENAGVSAGNGCTYIGGSAGLLTTGDLNFGMGGDAVRDLGGGGNNVGIGFGALKGVGSIAFKNVAIGTFALNACAAENNIGIGYAAGVAIGIGGANCVIGTFTGSSITTGSVNTLIGTGAGSSIVGGNYNTIIGNYNATAAVSNNVILSDGNSTRAFHYDPTNGIYIGNSAAFFLRTLTTLTNNAAAQTATMTNGPTAGNPTKWFAIDDNGTTRYIPAW